MDKGKKGAIVAGAALALGATILVLTRVRAAPPEGKANLYGKVTNSLTGNPIPGVKVTLEEGTPIYTDSSGNYAILNITADSFPFGAWIYFRKAGYEPRDATTTINEGNNELNVQMVPAAPPTTYTCPYCGDEFSTEEALLQHIEDEHGEPPTGDYKCSYCGETFSTFDELVAHIMSTHPGERIPIDIIWS